MAAKDRELEKELDYFCVRFVEGPGRYRKLVKDFDLILRPEEAKLLSFLCWYLSNFKESASSKKGWFYCTSLRIRAEMRWEVGKEERIMKSLREMGFIKTTMKGRRRRRYILINRKRITQEVEDAVLKWNKGHPREAEEIRRIAKQREEHGQKKRGV